MKACSAGNVARIRMDKQRRVQRDVQFLPYLPCSGNIQNIASQYWQRISMKKIFAAAEEAQNSHFHQLRRSRLKLREV